MILLCREQKKEVKPIRVQHSKECSQCRLLRWFTTYTAVDQQCNFKKIPKDKERFTHHFAHKLQVLYSLFVNLIITEGVILMDMYGHTHNYAPTLGILCFFKPFLTTLSLSNCCEIWHLSKKKTSSAAGGGGENCRPPSCSWEVTHYFVNHQLLYIYNLLQLYKRLFLWVDLVLHLGTAWISCRDGRPWFEGVRGESIKLGSEAGRGEVSMFVMVGPLWT